MLALFILPALATKEEMIDWAEKQGVVQDIALFLGPDGLLRGGALVDVSTNHDRRVMEVYWNQSRHRVRTLLLGARTVT